METQEFQLNTFNRDGIEIFAAGTWNNNTYSEEDLDNMVSNFGSLQGMRVPLKLGHTDKQKLAQRDGLPSVGWITSLTRVGKKLVAGIEGIPKAINELIGAGAYGRFSAEIYHNFERGGNVYKRVLAAVALLGDEMPAVETISDIVGLYSKPDEAGTGELFAYHNIEQEVTQVEEATKESIPDNSEIEALKVKFSAQETELEALKAQLAERDAILEAQKIEQTRKEVYALVDGAIQSGKIPPAAREQFAALGLIDFETEDKKHTYTIDSEEKNIQGNQIDILGKIIEVLPVNALLTKEFTKEVEVPEALTLDQKTKNYMAEHKVSYMEAFKAVGRME